MMRTIGVRLAWIAAAFWLMWGSPALAEILTLAADEWCPFNCKPDDEKPGYVVEIAKEIFEPAGHVVEYRLLPWKRALAEGKAGRIGGVIGLIRAESEAFLIPEEEIGLQSNAFFTRVEDPWRFTSMESLDGLRIGVILGYSYGENIDAYLAAHPDQTDALGGEAPLVMNLKKLLAGRIDALVDNPSVVLYRAKLMNVRDRIHMSGNDGLYDNLYLAFSKALPESARRAAMFDEGVRNLRLSGRLAAIMDKYGLSDWKPLQAKTQ